LKGKGRGRGKLSSKNNTNRLHRRGEKSAPRRKKSMGSRTCKTEGKSGLREKKTSSMERDHLRPRKKREKLAAHTLRKQEGEGALEAKREGKFGSDAETLQGDLKGIHVKEKEK